MEEKQLLDWINVFKVNRKIKSRLWPWIKIILSIILFFAVFYGDIYVHILDKTKTGRIVEALILVVFSFLDYLICFISVAEMDCLKDRRYAELLSEIKAVRASCEGKVLKVIVETCLLSEEEKIRVCGLVAASGADFIKTSTGFSSGGATREDIRLFAEHRTPTLKIKAAGGISTFEDAEALLSLGADRLGTSRLVKLAMKAGIAGPGGPRK